MSIRIVASIVGVLGLLLGSALASPCPSGCLQQKSGCLQLARATRRACKAACRGNADPAGIGACLQACRGTFRVGKRVCQAALHSCMETCPPSSNCFGDCGNTLDDCKRSVAESGLVCAADCILASDRTACLKDCAATAQTALDACQAASDACRAACGASPGGAFVE